MLCVLGYVVTNRFRELERPQTGRLKDVVLMATVTGFESLRIPSKSDMRQFAELFEPLFLGSSNEARRQAAAALSQCPHVPEAVALLIGNMPISIAAAFLTRSKAISDRALVSIIREQGAAHAAAIARRENLSPSLVDALVEHHQPASLPERPRAGAAPAAQETRAAASDREEKLREDIKALARAGTRDRAKTPRLQPIDELHCALLMRFARNGEAVLFATALADALGASRDLAERILLDVSGQQLAATLSALAFPAGDMDRLLVALYPHLSERLGGSTRAEVLIENVDRQASVERVEAWLRADAHEGPARREALFAENRPADPRRQETRPAPTQGTSAQPQRGFGRR
ncbi:DUF2336 domain-containing protein [Sinorhizobium saheli]|uniref:DUF2336 domain-containing protein n=1 Tax=Sinorhizobium saheli TaxID=36856 RepID=A0A178YB71_SINSA|nr:DUF2336 domain-containing protein [Sinorhizobium saheli]MQW86718.1 DUF2336 domain-containing protein [Sinorhizobium saheli]OAP44697.1 hypothetical protein ATB98_17685 [Sinorhizobium saheli]